VTDEPVLLDDEAFYRELMVRAELITARLCIASWRRRIRETESRIRELEQKLPAESPLRSDA
jgi:hypothetical protein